MSRSSSGVVRHTPPPERMATRSAPPSTKTLIGPAPWRRRRLGRDPCRRKGGGVGDARVTAASVDEGRPLPGDAVELGAVRLAPLGQLVGAVAHALLPLARLQAPAVLKEAVEDV